MNNKEKGNKGERIIENYLIERGYIILARNYRYKKKEVDIIAKKENVIAFVEVKNRWSGVFGKGFESVAHKKMKNITMVAKDFISKHAYFNFNIRFDVASIDNGEITYYKNAFNMIY